MFKLMSLVLFGAALSACGSSEVVAPTMNVSIGQQLMDLKQAKDKGVISQSEWDQQKQRLIKSVQ